MSLYSSVWCLLLVLLASCQSSAYLHTVYVDNTNSNSSDSSQCGDTKTSPCQTLEYTLEHRLVDDTEVVIVGPGYYTLNDSVTISNLSFVAIKTSEIGQFHDGDVTVPCTPGAGLSFVNCSDITLYGLQFLHCSAIQQSTSRNFNSTVHSFMEFPVSLYFLMCKNINLTEVTISHSSGTGLAVYATSGENYIENCNFTHNGSPDNKTYPSGGGVYIEFPFCSPLDPAACQGKPLYYNDDYLVIGASYQISGIQSSGNVAHMWHPIGYEYLLPQATNHLSFGKGGGLSVFFSLAIKTSIVITNSLFENNRAEWGGGAVVEFRTMSFNNSFTMESCVFQNNSAIVNVSDSRFRGGGGVSLRYTSESQNSSLMAYNRVNFINCIFHINRAFWGGGMLIRAVRELQEYPTNTLEFWNCSWSENLGRVGSAIDLAIWGPALTGTSLHPKFTDCAFTRNDDIFTVLSHLGHPISTGSVYTSSIPLLFETTVLFAGNMRSALTSVDAMLDFAEGCNATFTNNSGRVGGAMALYGSGYIRIHDDTNMTFVKNSAFQFGGAIYYAARGQHEQYLFGYCFIQYGDYMTPPWEWTANFFFSGNKATYHDSGDAIYATSLIPCLWSYFSPNSSKVIPEPRQDVFCWSDAGSDDNWVYEGSTCYQAVSSAPATFNNSPYSMDIVLGKREIMPVEVIGDKGKDRTSNAVFNLWSHSPDVAQIPPEYNYVSDNTILIYGTPNETATLTIETISPRVLYSQITLNILPCPPGFIYFNKSADDSGCVCNEQFRSVLLCDQSKYTAKLRQGIWMGKDPFTHKVVVGIYQYSRKDTKDIYFELESDLTELDRQLCGHANRTGPFCAECTENYSPSINSLFPHCVKCTEKDVRYFWLMYLLVEVLPLTVFLIVIMLFHISVTRGAVNSFVLFAQLVTTTFDITGDGTIPLHTITSSAVNMEKAYRVIYNFWNLNFFISVTGDFCLARNLKTVTVLSFHYFLAFYSFALIFVFFILVKLYDHGIQPFFMLGKPIHLLLRFFGKRWNLGRSTVDAFSTFLVLSATKFTVVSVYLLTPVTYIDSEGTRPGELVYFQADMKYLSREHYPYFFLALFVMLTFVIIPTLLLFVYPLKLLEIVVGKCGPRFRFLKPGNRMKLFLDTFQGCFKDGTNGTCDCRFFAGVYFLLRTVLLTSYAYTGIWLQQFAVQQLVCTVAIVLFAIFRPYKKDFYNHLDIVMLGILSIINALSMYNTYYASQGYALLSWAFAIQYILIYCPLIYLICYIIWKIFRSRKVYVVQFLEKWFGYNPSERQALLTNVVDENENPSRNSIDEEYRQFADQVEAYGRDRERNQYKRSTNSTTTSDGAQGTTNTITSEGEITTTTAVRRSTSGVSTGIQSDT